MQAPLALRIIFLLVAVAAAKTVYYVKPDDDNGDLNTTCPKENGTVCKHLSEYLENTNIYFSNNTKMIFLSGVHYLSLLVDISNVQNFSMVGSKEISSDMRGGENERESVIRCNSPNSGIYFSNSRNISIENLDLSECSGKIPLGDKKDIRIGLAFKRVHRINLTNIAINNTDGFGLHMDRCSGLLLINSSSLSNNKRTADYCGGNARFHFSKCPVEQSSILNIDSSQFLDGVDFTSDRSSSKAVHSASGLAIIINCTNVHVKINNITAARNRGGRNGGNVAISLTDYPKSVEIIINNSTIKDGSGLRGAGLKFLSGSDFDPWLCDNDNRQENHSTLHISNTHFTGNRAHSSAGAVYISQYESDCVPRLINFTSCIFTNNSIQPLGHGAAMKSHGAAIEVIKYKIPGIYAHRILQFEINFQSCNFTDNYVVVDNMHYNETYDQSSIADFLSIHRVAMADCEFAHNKGTAVSLRNSNLIVSAKNVFKHNTATNGGALTLCDGSIISILQSNSTKVQFIGNHATKIGGAIYSQQACLDDAPACFFQPLLLYNSFDSIPTSELHRAVEFVNNSADIAGDAIFGGSIDNCYTFLRFSDNKNNKTGHYISDAVFNSTFEWQSGQSGNSIFSSNPYDVCLCDADTNSIDCNSKNKEISSVPGKEIRISVIAVGQRSGIAPGTIIEVIPNKSLGNINKLQIKSQTKNVCIEMSFQIFSKDPITGFALRVQNHGPTCVHDRQSKELSVTVKLGKCPFGYTLSKQSPFECTCDRLLTKYFTCNKTQFTIKREHDKQAWVGCDRATNSSEPVASCKGRDLLRSESCGLTGYCNFTQTPTIPENNTDIQCSRGRTGMICSKCKPGQSLILGTSRCAICSNRYIPLVILYLLAGILLVVLLTMLNLTVTEGTINGLVFYANIIHFNQDVFFSLDYPNNMARIFIAWLNLDLGFEVCFYNGMDAYQKIWLQFGYLFYIWSIQAVIIILSRKFVFFTRLFRRNILKVLSTIILLCYAKIVRHVVDVFKFDLLKSSGGGSRLIWSLQGEVEYFGRKHIPLVIIAFVLAILTTFCTLTLLFIQCLERVSSWRILRWVERFRPIFDTFTGPCNYNYRFWPGFLFFLRLSLFIGYSTGNVDWLDPRLAYTFIICFLLIILSCLFPRGIYKKWSLNVLEFVFFVNLGITSLLTLIKNSTQKHLFSTIDMSVGITLIMFIGILIKHSYTQLKNQKWFRKFSKSFSVRFRQKRCRSFIPHTDRERYVTNTSSKSDNHVHSAETIPLLQEASPTKIPPFVQFNELRESLLEDKVITEQ